MSDLDDLLNSIFDGTDTAPLPEFEGWARSSRRFRDFAYTYRSKIRAKLRNAHQNARLDDVRAELETAALLLREKRFTLEYEKYAALRQRGPDFTVTFRTHIPFNVEVRRIRSAESDSAGPQVDKLVAIVCDKAGQMPPSIVNFLWLAAERRISEAELAEATSALLQLAERKVESFFTQRGFTSAAAFLKQYQRLSGIVAHAPGETAVWLNPVARHKAPGDVVTAIRRLWPWGD